MSELVLGPTYKKEQNHIKILHFIILKVFAVSLKLFCFKAKPWQFANNSEILSRTDFRAQQVPLLSNIKNIS